MFHALQGEHYDDPQVNFAQDLITAIAALYGEASACAVDLTGEQLEKLIFSVGSSPYIMLNDLNIATARLRCAREIAALTLQ